MASKEDEKTHMTVSEIMTKKVQTLDKNDTVGEAIDIMAKKSISCIVVANGKEAQGVITERDLIKRIYAKRRDPDKIKLVDAMTSPVLSIDPDTDVINAGNIMRKNKIRRLCISYDDELVGIITETDVLAATIRYIKHLNWRLVEGQITQNEYSRILKDVKLLVNV